MNKINLIIFTLITIGILNGCMPDCKEWVAKNDSLIKQIDSLKSIISLEPVSAREPNIFSNEFLLNPLPPPPDPCNHRIADGDHEIKFDVASQYILNFQIPYFNNNIKNGWTEIPISYLTEHFSSAAQPPALGETDRCGLLLYFCYDKVKKEFYVAYSVNYQLESKPDPFPIKNSAVFIKSICSNKFRYSTSDPDKMKNKLKSINPPMDYDPLPYSQPNDTLNFTDINIAANDFLIYILSANSGKQGVLENPVGFFHYTQIYDLIRQGTFKGIRIYLAYKENDPNTPYDANFIKIVAFAINSNGSNYCFTSGTTSAKILEKSWPPF